MNSYLAIPPGRRACRGWANAHGHAKRVSVRRIAARPVFPGGACELAIDLVIHFARAQMGNSPIRPGDMMKGWFHGPFPFEPAESERMLYVFADEVMSGPVRIPGSLP